MKRQHHPRATVNNPNFQAVGPLEKQTQLTKQKTNVITTEVKLSNSGYLNGAFVGGVVLVVEMQKMPNKDVLLLENRR